MPVNPRFTQAYSSQLGVAWDLALPGDTPWTVISADPSFTVWHSSSVQLPGTEGTDYGGLAPGTTYYFKVKNAAEPDDQYTAVISSATDPVAPTAISVQAVHPSSAAITWNSAGNSAGTLYLIEAGIDPAYSIAAAVSTATWPGAGLPYELEGLSPDTTYHMRIRALGFGLTDSDFAVIGATVTLAVSPDYPSYDAVYSTRASLSWSPEENPYWTIYETQVSTDGFATVNYSTRAAADYISPYPLTPNTTHYFRTAAVNGYGHYSEFMTFLSTLTLSAAPAPHAAPLTLLDDDYNSVTAQWADNGNPGYTEYYVQASTDPSFNGIDAGNPREWAAGLSATVTPLDPSTEYFFRARSRDLYGRMSGWLDLGSINTEAGADVAPPTIYSTQTGDDTWRGSSGGLYQVYFTDLVSGLARFDVKATTGPDMNSTEIAPWTTAASFAGENEYLTAWPLPAAVFSAIPEGATAYISVRVYDMADNVAYSTAPFYVRRDLTAPAAGSPSASPAGWLGSDPGAVFTLPFTDALSGLTLVQYSASRSAATGNGNVLGWTAIDSFVSSASWSESWGVNFEALQDAVTNYITVRAYDAAGNATQVTDAFLVLKNTIGPFVGVTWPSALFTSSAAAITGTASPSDSTSEVAAVEVALRQESSGLYWDGDSAFSSAAHGWLTPSGLEAWSLDVSTLPLVNLSSYTAVVRALDDMARWTADYSSFTFTLDTGAPAVHVSTPVNDSQVYYFDEVSGTAADGTDEAGLARVEVAVRRTADGRWWNPFLRSWTSAFVSSAAVGGASWSFYPDARLRGELIHELTYYVTASAYDSAYPANSTGFSVQGTTFTYHDTVPPAAPYSVAGTSGTLPGRMEVSWIFAGDDGNTGYLPQGGFAVHYATWTGFSPSTSSAQVQVSTAALEAGTTITYLVADLWSNTTYYFRVWARDDAGLWSAVSAEGEGVSGEDLDRRIAGHVRLPSGAGVTGILMEAVNNSGETVATAYTIDDGSGSFTLTDLDDGIYRVQATWVSDDIVSSVSKDGIPMGYADTYFVLSSEFLLASVSGVIPAGLRTSGLRPAAAAGGTVKLLQLGRPVAAVAPDASGEYRFSGLLPGVYTLRFETEAGVSDYRVTLTPGMDLFFTPLAGPLREGTAYAYPNPAGSGWVKFHFKTDAASVRRQVSVFTLDGRLVRRINDSAGWTSPAAGTHEYRWDFSGEKIAPGVYFCSLKVQDAATGDTRVKIMKLAVIR
ncbi:MAG TPA: hypothetical protein DDW67_03930 [Elusimicrobia bacterium]|nr:hypothetical protein [Elusimicrobiota bacterium]